MWGLKDESKKEANPLLEPFEANPGSDCMETEFEPIIVAFCCNF
jgi:hypothetical protein